LSRLTTVKTAIFFVTRVPTGIYQENMVPLLSVHIGSSTEGRTSEGAPFG